MASFSGDIRGGGRGVRVRSMGEVVFLLPFDITAFLLVASSTGFLVLGMVENKSTMVQYGRRGGYLTKKSIDMTRT